jgi:hypothetical protein
VVVELGARATIRAAAVRRGDPGEWQQARGRECGLQLRGWGSE